jgi:hypothetical protein
LKKLSVSYPNGTTALTILQNICKMLGIPQGKVAADVGDKPYPHHFAFSGYAYEALDKLSRYLNVEWSIQDGNLKAVNNGASDTSPVSVISPDTGMIGRPIKLANVDPDIKATALTPNIGVPGWKVDSLLIPAVECCAKIVVNSESIPKNQVFTVWSVEHKGDTHGQDWGTTLEVSKISEKAPAAVVQTEADFVED